MVFHYWILSSWFGLGITISIWDSLLSTILIASCSAAIGSGFVTFVPMGSNVLSIVIPSLIMAGLCYWLMQKGLEQLGYDDEFYLSFLDQSRPVRFALSLVFILAVSSSTFFYGKLKEQQEGEERKETTASMIREAELQKLQLQLQPHFLFNALNSINALIIVKPEEARKMVHHLSDFLRTTIKRADEHWITLSEEWNYLQLYLDIEKVRFGHRLEVNTNFRNESLTWKIPTLLLQPIVENAIKFGLYGTTEKVNITLDAFDEHEMLNVKITNPFDSEIQPPKGSGFGLSGIKRRLYLLFARNDLLETRVEGNLFTVVLKIPKQA
jgi:sensor histidine kinase YesM